ICFALGIALVYLWVRAGGPNAAWFFGRAVDPARSLHRAWAIVALGMGGTNYGCRFIDHNYLSGVHEGFFAITLVVYAVLVPRLLWLAVVARRKSTSSALAA
ncbi:MAG: hypothetical protein IAI50_18990, partial [Candidatus Eremiobacteraeota bacterium]|nr:hypothetical protein [Candidatus Eremiobacteraeota bacterium]